MGKCAVIVSVYNEREGVEESISYLEHLANLGFDAHIVDDGSTDGTREVIDSYSKEGNSRVHTYFMEENSKRVGALKEVLKRLSPEVEYVAVLDTNSKYENPKEILNIVKKMENEGIDAGAFKIRPSETRTLPQALQNLEWVIFDNYKRFRSMRNKSFLIPGGCGIHRKDMLEEVLKEHSGEFNGDDLETSIIINRKGYKTRFFPEVEVRKKVPETFKERKEQIDGWNDGQKRVKREYFKGSILDFNRETGNYYSFLIK